ncbi:MAG TPA: HypC/HybG/HupF family hydrogenase formation chaperone [Gaiellaceae bacterium]|nr:HypC/HybG/HupF family hydrogenase formation chaperone [Gaiellaceae bacterium]
MTCSDEGIPMTVTAVRPGALALCETDLEVMTDLVGPVEPGDVVLVHAGVAIARVEA